MTDEDNGGTKTLARTEPRTLAAPMSEFDLRWKVAGRLLESGFMPKSINTRAKAFAVMQAGSELGIGPMTAIRSLHVIDGKVGMAAELMLARAYTFVPGFGCEILSTGSKGCTLRMRREGVDWQEFSFVEADAKRAGLLGKGNWKSYPDAMYRARAISAGCRVVAPDAIARMYTPEELGATTVIAEDGSEVIDVTPQPEIDDAEADALFEAAKQGDADDEWLLAVEARLDELPHPVAINNWRKKHEAEIREKPPAIGVRALKLCEDRIKELNDEPPTPEGE